MSAGPSLEARLEALALRLAVGVDVASVMSVRSDIIELIGESLKTGGDPDHLGLRRRARELRKQAESVCGQLLALMQERGERRGHGGDQRTPQGRARVSLADLGFAYRELAEKWVRRGRAEARSFNVRVAAATDVETIRSLIAECSAEGRAALRCKDRGAHQIAVARRMAAKRRGGMLLTSGAADGTELPASLAPRWRRLARLSEDAFLAAVERGAEEARHAPEPVQQIKMVQTEFQVDERGNLHRRAFAVDAPQSDLKF